MRSHNFDIIYEVTHFQLLTCSTLWVRKRMILIWTFARPEWSCLWTYSGAAWPLSACSSLPYQLWASIVHWTLCNSLLFAMVDLEWDCPPVHITLVGQVWRMNACWSDHMYNIDRGGGGVGHSVDDTLDRPASPDIRGQTRTPEVIPTRCALSRLLCSLCAVGAAVCAEREEELRCDSYANNKTKPTLPCFPRAPTHPYTRHHHHHSFSSYGIKAPSATTAPLSTSTRSREGGFHAITTTRILLRGNCHSRLKAARMVVLTYANCKLTEP